MSELPNIAFCSLVYLVCDKEKIDIVTCKYMWHVKEVPGMQVFMWYGPEHAWYQNAKFFPF